MSDSAPALPQSGVQGKLTGAKARQILQDGIYKANPVMHQILGICIFLAVTNRLANSIVMGLALVFVLGMSNLFVSLLRNTIPRRIRMIAEVAIIATFVIFLDQMLRAFYWDMSRTLGPYVALIITNCIVMGRAEGFALLNPPLPSLLDGVANGLGYGLILIIIGLFRELVGFGSILGRTVLPAAWYEPNLIFVLAPGAFFAAGFLTWVFNALRPPQAREAGR